MIDKRFLVMHSDIMLSNLTVLEKVILSEIVGLKRNGLVCFMTNKSFADKWNVSIRTIINSLNALRKKGLIQSQESRPFGNVKTKRILVPCLTCMDKYFSNKTLDCTDSAKYDSS